MTDLVAAQPGFYVLSLDRDSDEVVKLPVVAWTRSAGGAFPILVQAYANPDNCPVLTPDGLVIDKGHGVFLGLDAWNYARKRRKEG